MDDASYHSNDNHDSARVVWSAGRAMDDLDSLTDEELCADHLAIRNILITAEKIGQRLQQAKETDKLLSLIRLCATDQELDELIVSDTFIDRVAKLPAKYGETITQAFKSRKRAINLFVEAVS